jgi:integrase
VLRLKAVIWFTIVKVLPVSVAIPTRTVVCDRPTHPQSRRWPRADGAKIVIIVGNGRKPYISGVDHSRPMRTYSYKTAFNTARHKAGIDYRLYDARHTFVTRLAENPKVSEETIRQLAGHVSPRMLARYAHIRVQAWRDAIATLERAEDGAQINDFSSDGAQNWATVEGIERAAPN